MVIPHVSVSTPADVNEETNFTISRAEDCNKKQQPSRQTRSCSLIIDESDDKIASDSFVASRHKWFLQGEGGGVDHRGGLSKQSTDEIDGNDDYDQEYLRSGTFQTLSDYSVDLIYERLGKGNELDVSTENNDDIRGSDNERLACVCSCCCNSSCCC